MAEKPESKPVPPKKPEGEKRAPIPNGVEKKEVQDRRRSLEDKTLKLKASRARSDHKRDEWDAQKLLKSFDLWVEKKEKKEDEKKDENFVETQETKDAKEKEKIETEYREELKKNYEAEKADIVGKSENWTEPSLNEEQKTKLQELQKTYLSKYVADFEINPKEIKPETIQKIAETMPDAWESLLLKEEFAKEWPLKTLRDQVLKELPAPDSEMNTETFEKFRKMFAEKTGLELSEEKIQKLIGDTRKIREELYQKEDNNPENKNIIRRDGNFSEQESAIRGSSISSGPAKNISPDETWSSSGYSPETWKQATESAKKSAEIIKSAFKKSEGWDEKTPWKLDKFIDRHASNNPNFSSDKPFLLQDLRNQKAYIYYPGGEIEECSATHGANGVSNVNNSHGTSLGSKELIPDSNGPRNGNSILYRTAVKGLESCNQSDLSRLIRIHEQHWWATWGCTGLPLDVMKRFDAAIDSAGGGAQEIFLS